MDINSILNGSGPVTFDAINAWAESSEQRHLAAAAAKKQAQDAKNKFHADLMDPNKPVAFKCDWCQTEHTKADLYVWGDNCFTTDNGETWCCADCELNASVCGRIDFKDYPHPYAFFDTDTDEFVSVPAPKPKKVVKRKAAYQHKYSKEDEDEFLPIGSEIVEHRGDKDEDLMFKVRLGPASPEQEHPENQWFEEDELRYEALEWVDEMLDEYKRKHSLEEEDSDDDFCLADLEEAAAAANSAQEESKSERRVTFSEDAAKIFVVPGFEEKRGGTWMIDGIRERDEALARIQGWWRRILAKAPQAVNPLDAEYDLELQCDEEFRNCGALEEEDPQPEQPSCTPGVKRFMDCVARLEALVVPAPGVQAGGGRGKKACKCGSQDHQRISHKSCPLNKKNNK
jgi:hypothetical protein